MVAISSASTSSWVPFTEAQKAARSPEERAQIESAEAWRVSADEDDARIASGRAVITYQGDGHRVDLSTYTFSSAGSGRDPMASLAETKVESHAVLAGSVEQVGADRLHDVISKLSDDIKANAFKGETFSGAKNGVLTDSPDVFLGWLKDREASLSPGAMIARTA